VGKKKPIKKEGAAKLGALIKLLKKSLGDLVSKKRRRKKASQKKEGRGLNSVNLLGWEYGNVKPNLGKGERFKW